jgi:hypothetical protein
LSAVLEVNVAHAARGVAAGDLQRDLTAFMKECFFKDPTLAAQHSRSRGGKGLFDKQYGVRCSIHHCTMPACPVILHIGCNARRFDVQCWWRCAPQGALQQLVLRRCLSLVLLLDCAAQRPGVLNDSTPLLFRLSVKPKLESSAEVRQTASFSASDGLMAAVMPSATPWTC